MVIAGDETCVRTQRTVGVDDARCFSAARTSFLRVPGAAALIGVVLRRPGDASTPISSLSLLLTASFYVYAGGLAVWCVCSLCRAPGLLFIEQGQQSVGERGKRRARAESSSCILIALPPSFLL
jgi:hypothetical protein